MFVVGDLASFDRLVVEAHRRNLKVIIDWVPNHCSDQHPWFFESRKDRANPKRDWYIWRDAKPDGSLPNNWGSLFGGSAWEWVEERKQYYLQTFLKEQPDLNWRNPEVHQAMLDTLRFWLERGVDGFRMDVLGMVYKNPALPDNPPRLEIPPGLPAGDLWNHQMNIYNQDQDDVQVVLQDIRRLLDQDMFTITEILSGKHILQLREELLTGMRCRISPERLNRRLETSFQAPPLPDFCPFCPGGIDTATPTFSDGKRISIGNSTTFPNLFPFAQWHTVSVLTRDHYQEKFSHSDLRDGFLGQIASLKEADGYKSINWNYLPSAGASIGHPHLSGDGGPAPLPIDREISEIRF